jgi:hypothetical protein
MDPAEIKGIIDTVGGLSVTAVLFLILVAGAREKPLWVFGSTHRRVVRELEIWRALALKSANVTDKAIQAQAQALDIAQQTKSGDDA